MEFFIDTVKGFWSEIVLVASNLFTFLFFRDKLKAKTQQEVYTAEKINLENIEDALNIYKKMLQDLHEELVEITAKHKKLEFEFAKLEARNKELTIRLQKAEEKADNNKCYFDESTDN